MNGQGGPREIYGRQWDNIYLLPHSQVFCELDDGLRKEKEYSWIMSNFRWIHTQVSIRHIA